MVMILSCSCSAESRATSPTPGLSTVPAGARLCTLEQNTKWTKHDELVIMWKCILCWEGVFFNVKEELELKPGAFERWPGLALCLRKCLSGELLPKRTLWLTARPPQKPTLVFISNTSFTWILPRCSWCAPPYDIDPPAPADWEAPRALNPHSAPGSTLSEAWKATPNRYSVC